MSKVKTVKKTKEVNIEVEEVKEVKEKVEKFKYEVKLSINVDKDVPPPEIVSGDEDVVKEA